MDDHTQTSFGARLKLAMINNGFNSHRSPYGVDISRLARITQHSPQICRKYLKNTALPSKETVLRLSEALNVSPGWLLFGESSSQHKNFVSLSPALLRCVIEEGFAVQHHFKSNHDFADFLMHIVEKIQKFDLPDLEIRQIIRCMTSAIGYIDAR
ncbi:MAG: helix-turn-helix transcriptional regulator [Gammaproteobacteria bacterium]